MRWMLLCWWLVVPGFVQGKVATFEARDTWDPGVKPQASEEEAGTWEALANLAWTPEAFTVTAVSSAGGDHDAVVWFDSPRPMLGAGVGAGQDRVPLAWYAARDAGGEVRRGPAVLIIHSLHPAMPLSTAAAREFAEEGRHAFVLHLPGYGLRHDRGARPTGVTSLLHGEQAVGDIRRARDAIRALPNVEGRSVAIVGVSLGGFAAATAASLDGAFDPVVLVLSGGDGYGVLQEGAVDAAVLRDSLAGVGYEGERLRGLLAKVEPLRFAHRLDPARTWLFSAEADQVVGRSSSDALAERIGLEPSHRVWLRTDHYLAALMLPAITKRIGRIFEEPVFAGGPEGLSRPSP